jgi:hypothetical protein
MSEDSELIPPQLIFDGICHTCARRRGVRTCEAFPNGIPGTILVGDFLHVRPYPGDNGLTYVKAIHPDGS